MILLSFSSFDEQTSPPKKKKKISFQRYPNAVIIPHESQNLFLWHETKKSFTEIHRDSQRKSSQRYSNANRKSQNLPHDSWSTKTIFHDFSIILHPFFFSLLPHSTLRFIKFTREIIRISRENSPRLISPPSIIEPSSTNQSAFARKFETFPRIFPSIYSIFPCRGARNDRHRLLIAGFPPLYRGWIDRASSLSSLQDSSSLRVPRCSRIVRGKVRCFSIAEKFFF